MERLMRLREPVAVITLVGVVLHLALSVLWAVRYLGPPGTAFPTLATQIIPPVLLVLLTAVLLACWLAEPTPHARGLTATGLVLTVALLVGAVGSAIAAVPTVPSSDDGGLAFLAWLVAPITVAVVSLAVQAGLLRRPVSEPVAAPPPELESAGAEPQPEPVDPEQQPTWTSDAAVGTVWRRAGDAASRRPATSWDDAPDQSGGWWGPEQDPDPQVEPTRRRTE